MGISRTVLVIHQSQCLRRGRRNSVVQTTRSVQHNLRRQKFVFIFILKELESYPKFLGGGGLIYFGPVWCNRYPCLRKTHKKKINKEKERERERTVLTLNNNSASPGGQW